MRQISPELKNHISGDLASMVTCWILTRRDGVRLAFTTHDKAIDFENLTFRPTNSFLPSAISSTNSLNVDNLAVHALLSSDGLTEKDIRAGLFDHGRISIFQVNWQDLSQGKLFIRSGWLGEFTLKDQNFTVEIRGLTQKLQQTIGDVYSPECRADLGGGDCHVNMEEFSVLGVITGGVGPDSFEDISRTEVDGWYDYGLVRFLRGANAGHRTEVRSFTGGNFILYDMPPEPMMVGDIYLVFAGCDKRSESCKNKFRNFQNYQGETAIPGTDSLYNYPGLK
ncbi:Gene Transfer Agent FAD/FMN-containing dehydrogenase [hydrothermal vent metagenome]|uniref:Gene Transfer Agent FAD/FMN-containing dehydrogenase n=1 Tax=hydrothermal vent metagenome TaxID=652676 RepID=A0A3B0T453_9ZZZZ